MKKFVSICTIFILSISLISCSAKTPNTTNNNKTNNSSVAKTTPNTGAAADTKYTTYLPPYMNNLKPDTIFPPSKENNGATLAIYTIKNAKSDDTFKNYETILKNDGWNIYQDVQGHSISAKKGDHDTTIIIQQSSNDVKLTISSK